jgi:hypothetical protein
MGAHLRRCFPELCLELGDSSVLQAIHYGIKRASVYGITIERDVCLFIDLMFLLGKHYYNDPSLPWVAEILHDEAMPDPSGRVRMLYDESLSRLGKGPGLLSDNRSSLGLSIEGFGFELPKDSTSA